MKTHEDENQGAKSEVPAQGSHAQALGQWIPSEKPPEVTKDVFSNRGTYVHCVGRYGKKAILTRERISEGEALPRFAD